MTEAKWLAATDPTRMLNFLKGRRRSDRKLWLFAVACFRRVGPGLDERVRQAIDVTERYADGRATDADMQEFNTRIDPVASAGHAIRHCSGQVGRPGRRAEALAQTALIRDVFGNPFRPVAIDPSWLTSDVLALANGIYDDRAFDRMPILADALQDAGCDDEQVLGHCRHGDGHVRGCWVVDLVLGKE